MTKDEALRLALEALSEAHYVVEHRQDVKKREQAITAIKATLEAKDEPVVYINVEQRKLEWAKYMSWDTPTVVNLPKIPLYTTPPQRTWIGLTEDEVFEISNKMPYADRFDFAEAIEAKLKEKNNG
jgi:hypothetical protein